MANDPLNGVDPSGLVSEGAVSTTASQVDLDLLYAELTNARLAGDLNLVNQILAEIDNLTRAASGAGGGFAPVDISGAGAAMAAEIEATAAAEGGVTAAERAAQIANTLGRTQRFVTIGVTDTAEGIRIISSSENALRPPALRALQQGEIPVTGPGHAEVTGINGARDLGLTPIGAAASRPICPLCAQFLHDQGIPPLGPIK